MDYYYEWKKQENFVNCQSSEVIKKYNINIPIENIDHIVNVMGGTIKLCEYDHWLDKTEDGLFTIHVPEAESYEHYKIKARRVNISHELGHLFLHTPFLSNPEEFIQSNKIIFNDEYKKELAECWAWEFGLGLLMPEDIFKEIVKQYTNNKVVSTDKVADYFNVTTTAASVRGKHLGLFKD